MIRAAAFTLLAACLALPARSQDPPPVERTDAAARELAAEVKASPTRPDTIKERMDRLMHFAMASGRPRRYLSKEKARAVQQVTLSGRYKDAARMVDELYFAAAEAAGRDPEPPGPPALPLGHPLGERPIVGPGHDTPIMLSRPPSDRPLPEGLARVNASPVEPIPPNIAAPEESPRPEEKPHGLVPLAALLILLAAGLIAAGLRIARREPAPAEAKQSLTDKYALGPLLTAGGMGEVYEGQDLALGRKVALKRMLPDLKLDASLRKQFLHEAKTVARLTHPYIVQIHDCMENGEDVYIVFEFVKGKTLAQVLTEKPRLSLKECLRIFSHVCPAIDHAHKNHVLHRDLKPANIMIDENGIARVMDFGIALESTRTVTSTGPGHLDASGTLRYMPPEQHYGKSVRASDIYAMGVCLYEMTTGTLPFAGGTVEELVEQKRARRFPAPSALVPGLPRELDLFVNSVLAPDPKERMGSALEFLELLERVASA
ncbi:MAG: serine/threonine protein kinase [Elusimicrobia bacterium]|nr:serine/threonine protein kinase [Elusimicrobiota bacterium]